MAGFDRYENILRLYLDSSSLWTVADMSAELETSPSNVYRTVRELVAAGFLENAIESHYRLGPVFLEFERRLRQSDPLVRSGVVFLTTLVEQAGITCCAALARLYGNKVMCVADARSPRFDMQTSYERGRPMPILRGATSKAVLSALPTRKRDRLLRLIAEGGEAVPEGLPRELDAIRKAGMVVTLGEVDRDLAGIAVPVRLPDLAIHASLSFIVKQSDLTEAHLARLEALLRSHAKLVENFVTTSDHDSQNSIK